MESLIDTHIRRTNRNLLLTNLGIFAFLVFVSWASYRYYYNFFYGPFPISRSDLLSLSNPQSKQEYFVAVHGDTILDTGFYRVEQTLDKYTKRVESESITGYYELLLIDQRLLIVYTERPSSSIDFVGSLESIPDDLQEELVDKSESPLREAILPFMLDATSFRTPGYWGLLFLVPAFAFSLWNIQKSVRRFINPSLHPIYKSLQRYGDPLEVARSINNEFQSRELFVQLPKCFLTASWLVVPTVFRTDFVHLIYILWVYKRRTKHSVNFIPIGTTFTAVIITRFGRKIEIHSTELGVNRILEALYQRVPWIQIGYSDELEKIFRKNPQELIAYVDNRREEYRSQREAEEDFKQSQSYNSASDEDLEKAKRYGKVLGLHGKVTIDDIKQNYRDLIAKYHPDKVQHLGEELQRVAEAKTKEINEAYEYFKKKYSFD